MKKYDGLILFASMALFGMAAAWVIAQRRAAAAGDPAATFDPNTDPLPWLRSYWNAVGFNTPALQGNDIAWTGGNVGTAITPRPNNGDAQWIDPALYSWNPP